MQSVTHCCCAVIEPSLLIKSCVKTSGTSTSAYKGRQLMLDGDGRGVACGRVSRSTCCCYQTARRFLGRTCHLRASYQCQAAAHTAPPVAERRNPAVLAVAASRGVQDAGIALLHSRAGKSVRLALGKLAAPKQDLASHAVAASQAANAGAVETLLLGTGAREAFRPGLRRGRATPETSRQRAPWQGCPSRGRTRGRRWARWGRWTGWCSHSWWP